MRLRSSARSADALCLSAYDFCSPSRVHIFNTSPAAASLQSPAAASVLWQVNPDEDSLQRLKALRGEKAAASAPAAAAAASNGAAAAADTSAPAADSAELQPASTTAAPAAQVEPPEPDSDEDALGGRSAVFLLTGLPVSNGLFYAVCRRALLIVQDEKSEGALLDVLSLPSPQKLHQCL